MNPVRVVIAIGVLFAASVALSSVHPWGNPRSAIQPDKPLMVGSAVPDEVERLLMAKCADCHSEKTHYPLYSRMAPASWLIERDIHEARGRFNMSRWQQLNQESQIDLLSRIASEVRSGQMPVRHYLILHPQARLSPAEQQLIYDWAKTERRQLKKQLAVATKERGQ
jgi:cytochrome c